MGWNILNAIEQLEAINEQSTTKPVIIFKHSTRCSISNMAKNRLENITDNNEAAFYYLDLLQHRPISNKIAEGYNVYHESPQALVIINGECVYEESHNGITAQDFQNEISVWSKKIVEN